MDKEKAIDKLILELNLNLESELEKLKKELKEMK